MDTSKNSFVRDIDLATRYAVSRSTIWRWAKLGLLPKPIKIAGSSRFDLTACDKAFESGGQQNAA